MWAYQSLDSGKEIFILSLFLNFLVVRLLSHTLHDKENYGTEKEKSKTLTYLIRKKTGRDFHHLHLGFALLPAGILISLVWRGPIAIILIAVSLSLIADQIIPWIKKEDYFSLASILEAGIIHIVLALIAVIISSF